MSDQIEKVKTYYEHTWKEYYAIWTGKNDLAMHFGYYDDTISSHSDSLLKLNEVIAAYGDITLNDHVLDAGCGYGGTSLWLAAHIGCQTTGITVVPSEVERAQKYARLRKLDTKTTFLLADYSNTDFPDNSFDVIIGIESVVHAQSKQDFLKEAYRLLKPKGRLMIAEYLIRDTPALSQKEQSLIHTWLDGWAMPSLLTERQYKTYMTEAGFHSLDCLDITQNVLPSFRRLQRFGNIFNISVVKLLMKLRLVDEISLGNRIGAQAGIEAMMSGVCQYKIHKAVK